MFRYGGSGLLGLCVGDNGLDRVGRLVGGLSGLSGLRRLGDLDIAGGEAVVAGYGIEGGAIYALSSDLRAAPGIL